MTSGYDAWMERLSRSEAVALGATIRELNELTASDETSVNQLAAVIMRDPALTSKVLRSANSAYFNPGGKTISTISRAIFQLGFSTIRSICLTAIMLETLLKEHPRERLLEVLAQSFHAAVQARNLCQHLPAEAREEVFVAALLYRVGELLIWASPHREVDGFQRIYQETGDNRLVEEQLGVKFQRLTQGLAAQWRLGDVLTAALHPGSKAPRKVAAVILGERISASVRQGMHSVEMKALLTKLGAYTETSEAEVRQTVLDGIEEASELTHAFGGRQLGPLIAGKMIPIDDDDDSDLLEQRLEPDPRVQLRILQDITQMMQQKLDTNMLFQMVIEGLHRGVGFERVALAVFDQKRTQVHAKFILGDRTMDWRERFRLPFERASNNLLQQVIERGEPCWLGHPNFADLETLRTPAFNTVVGRGECCIAPIVVDHKEIGFLYGDLRVSGRPMTAEYVGGFNHFLQQARLCLIMLARHS